MTGKEAIIHYLEMHKSFCTPDVAATTGVTLTSINQAAAKMARAGILVIDGKVWRTVYYRFATREEREGKVSTNLIFKECRQSAAMKRVLAVYGRLVITWFDGYLENIQSNLMVCFVRGTITMFLAWCCMN